MPPFLEIINQGPLITASNYWQSEAALHGKLYLSINAGALRLLVPLSLRPAISEMRPGAQHVVASFLAAPQWRAGAHCMEWMVEDGTSAPWSCHLSPGQIDRCPGPDDAGKQWIATVWDETSGKPHKCIELPAYVQIVPSLPWLRKISA